MHNPAVRANRNINAGLLEIFVARVANVDNRRRLPAPNSLRLARDTNRAAANPNLHEIRARFRQKIKSVRVDNIARANFHILAKIFMNVPERYPLPFAETFRRIDTQNVRARFQKRRNPLSIIARVNPSADDIPLALVNQFQRIGLVVGVILAENHVAQTLIFVDQRQHVQLVFPNQIVRLRQRCRLGGRPD